jgi:hypothetical protein
MWSSQHRNTDNAALCIMPGPVVRMRPDLKGIAIMTEAGIDSACRRLALLRASVLTLLGRSDVPFLVWDEYWWAIRQRSISGLGVQIDQMTHEIHGQGCWAASIFVAPLPGRCATPSRSRYPHRFGRHASRCPSNRTVDCGEDLRKGIRCLGRPRAAILVPLDIQVLLVPSRSAS